MLPHKVNLERVKNNKELPKEPLERIADALEGINESLKIVAESKDITHLFKKKKYNIPTTDAWVVEPYSICLTSMPPKYISRICHYHDPNYVDVDCIKRMGNHKIFYTKHEAIEYCEVTLGTKYEIIDCIVPESIVIGPDYE